MLMTVLAFVVALALLIAVHEYGHYRVAIACGVKVLRFSIGFGHVVWRWQKPGSPTEFAIGALPLGGYVKMLDEREGPVDPAERHLAFNNQSVGKRAAIVAAGPAANLILAVALYAVVNWIGTDEPVARLAEPLPASIAAKAGLRGGDEVIALGRDGEPAEPVRSFDDMHWQLTRAAIDGQTVSMDVRGSDGRQRRIDLPLDRLSSREADARMTREIGIAGPLTVPLIGEVQAGGAAAAAGLQRGDIVRRIGAVAIADGVQLRDAIRASVKNGRALGQTWQIERAGQRLDLAVTPAVIAENGQNIGRVGAFVGGPPETVRVRYGVVEGLWRGVAKTWEVSSLSLRMMGRMVIGEASLKNLSGPLTIADYAGRSASMGLVQYLVFLALISVSLGVLNLLPLPVLDGGHLVFFAWEAITGRGVSEAWLGHLQRGGVAVLMLAMSIALFNDVSRIFG
ncbi:RIP metalloprotease RseP [Xylophilus sp. GOD-11R]|uniref:RIP metalloprotease RseP n=1 Tax=Xylophilus sp. GOD-11R TaxID=3089814 RepID=UPI00298BE948|nr:RIP metalloprotease RseP [Xylophilus sp. GOD-11R]WPB58682.1 RIP metalloprotease RseP [Xylophilus sp. GOD-11R]